MRFVFFYDRVVNVNSILWVMGVPPNAEMSSFPTFVMKLKDGTTLTARVNNSLDFDRYTNLLANLQAPDLSRVSNLYEESDRI